MSLVKQAFELGQKRLLEKGVEEEKTKKGTLRGGNTGMMDNNGRVMGACAARTYLRYQGVNVDPVDTSRDLMFAGGRANEDIWEEYLNAGWDGTMLREENVPTRWETENGTAVTGRPDVVLIDKEGTKQVGIELKQIMSLWTARSITCEGIPKTAHILQASHYSWQLGIPFEIWYTNRTDFALGADWIKKMFPKYGEKLSERVQYNFYRLGEINARTGYPTKHKSTEEEYLYYLNAPDTGVKVIADALKVLPFVHGFQLRMDPEDKQVYYKNAMDADSDWERSIVNVDDIERYYNHISVMDTVPAEPLTAKANGMKENYKLSDYCSLGNLCCKHNKGKDIQVWTNRVKKELV